jgi:hypothetical protein
MFWWESDKYDGDHVLPEEFRHLAGPNGVACVRVYPNGKTDPGWGMTPDKTGRAFADNYAANKFNEQIALIGTLSGRWDFAFVMRSLKVVCIDIDGKNGGMQHVGKLGMLPPTMAETSKSGDGYHLFYATPWDVWDEEAGFAMFKDRISIVPGVDIRAVGCVYHHDIQRWNDRSIVPLPDFQKDTWLARALKAEKEIDEIIELLDMGDDDQVLVIRTNLMTDLAKPIPAGRRNTTLYAIGVKMLLAGVPSWETPLYNRAIQVGLDSEEAKKLVGNVRKYR